MKIKESIRELGLIIDCINKDQVYTIFPKTRDYDALKNIHTTLSKAYMNNKGRVLPRKIKVNIDFKEIKRINELSLSMKILRIFQLNRNPGILYLGDLKDYLEENNICTNRKLINQSLLFLTRKGYIERQSYGIYSITYKGVTFFI